MLDIITNLEGLEEIVADTEVELKPSEVGIKTISNV